MPSWISGGSTSRRDAAAALAAIAEMASGSVEYVATVSFSLLSRVRMDSVPFL